MSHDASIRFQVYFYQTWNFVYKILSSSLYLTWTWVSSCIWEFHVKLEILNWTSIFQVWLENLKLNLRFRVHDFIHKLGLSMIFFGLREGCYFWRSHFWFFIERCLFFAMDFLVFTRVRPFVTKSFFPSHFMQSRSPVTVLRCREKYV